MSTGSVALEIGRTLGGFHLRSGKVLPRRSGRVLSFPARKGVGVSGVLIAQTSCSWISVLYGSTPVAEVVGFGHREEYVG